MHLDEKNTKEGMLFNAINKLSSIANNNPYENIDTMLSFLVILLKGKNTYINFLAKPIKI